MGTATADALRKLGLRANFVPREFVGEAIADGLGDVAGQKVLIARAELGRDAMANIMREHFD